MADSSNINDEFYEPPKQPTSYNRKANLSVNVNGNTILNSNCNANLNIEINHKTKLNPYTIINVTTNDDLTNNASDGADLYEDDLDQDDSDINIQNRLAKMDRRVQEMYRDVCDMQAAGGELFPPPPPPPRPQDPGNGVSDSGVAPAIDSQPQENRSSQCQSVPSTTILPSPATDRVSIRTQLSSDSDSSVPEPPKTAHSSNSRPQCCVLRSPKWCRCKCHKIENISREEGICPYWPTSSHQDESLNVFNNLLPKFSSGSPEIKDPASDQQFNSKVPIPITYNYNSREALWKVFNVVDVIQLNDSLRELLNTKHWGDRDCRVAANFLVDILIPGYFWGSNKFGDMFEPTLPMPSKEMREPVARLLATYGKPVASTVSSGAGETSDIQSCGPTPTSSSAEDQAQTKAVETTSSPMTVQEESAPEPIYIPGGKISQWNHKRRDSSDSFDMGPPSPGSSIYEESSAPEFEPKSYGSFDRMENPEPSPSYEAIIAGQNPEDIPIWWGLGDRASFRGPDDECEHDDVLKPGWTFPKRMSISLYSDSDYGELGDEERWDKLVVKKPEIFLSGVNTGGEEVEMTTVLGEKKISSSDESEGKAEDGEADVTCALVEKKMSNYESPSIVSDDGED